MYVSVAVGLGVLLVAHAFASAPLGAGSTRVSTGRWGGRHVALTVTEAGASVEFDCASGEIGEPLTIDGSSALIVDGVFIRERPGSQRAGDEPEKQPARYAGRIDGDTLTFEVTLK